LCGRSFVQLAAHLGPAHGMTADGYKERYGIPWTYGLAGKAFKRASSRRLRATRTSGKLAPRPTEAHVAKLVKAARGRRSSVAAVSNDNKQGKGPRNPPPGSKTWK